MSEKLSCEPGTQLQRTILWNFQIEKLSLICLGAEIDCRRVVLNFPLIENPEQLEWGLYNL